MNSQISEHATEVELWIVLTAIHQPELLAKRKDLHLDRNKDVVELCRLGCDARVLQGFLVFAAEMPKFYPPISAPVLQKLARDLRDVLRRMIRTTPSLALPWVRELKKGARVFYSLPTGGGLRVSPGILKELSRVRVLKKGGLEVYTEPTGGDLYVSAELQKELSLKADCYEGLARLCTQNMVPTRAQIQKLAYLWPVFYVEEKTRKYHYAKVAKLLGFVEIDKNEKQLMRGVADAKRTLPQVVNWMKWSLSYIEQLSGPARGAVAGTVG
jgi:hypothetical protein